MGETLAVELSASDLHIWHISLDRNALLNKSFPALPSASEAQRTANMNHPELRQCYLKTRWAMRHILGCYLKTPAEKVQLHYAEQGKPALVSGKYALDLHFNLTHSGEWALLAVTLGAQVGIDMEKVTQKLHPIRLAKRYFTQAVVAQLEELAEAEQQAALLKLWTQYEAYKKAQGVGLRGGDGLLPLSIDIGRHQFHAFPTDTGAASEWLVAQLHPADQHIGAVVIERTQTQPQLSHINYDDDINTAC